MLIRAFILWFSIINCAIANDAVKINNLSILVNSCDKYSELWKPFEYYLLKHWPSLKDHNNLPIYFISNNKFPDSTRFTSIRIKNETSWSDTFLAALNNVKTDYVLILLEDYVFYKDVNEARLQEVFDKMQQLDASYMQIALDDKRETGPDVIGIKGMRYSSKHEPWRTSLQACISFKY